MDNRIHCRIPAAVVRLKPVLREATPHVIARRLESDIDAPSQVTEYGSELSRNSNASRFNGLDFSSEVGPKSFHQLAHPSDEVGSLHGFDQLGRKSSRAENERRHSNTGGAP